jgi:Ca2+/Na+ antiporter
MTGDADTEEIVSSSRHTLAVHNSFVYGSGGVSATSRSLNDLTEGCKKPGSKGSKAAICAYVASNCPKNSGGYIDYLDLFYCSKWLGGNRSLAWASLVLWVLFLFLALGTISNDYFVPALTSVSYSLSIPAEIAGLTLLAFGNGAPNVAGYFASVTNKTFDLAIGDVFGGTFYVVTVVLASVCFFGKNILLDGHSFKRDVSFLTVAVIAVFVFIWTGRFYIYESIALLVFYIFYVIWASVYDLMRQRRARLALKRARAAAGLPMPTKRSYRSRSSVFKKQSIASIDTHAINHSDSITATNTSVNRNSGDFSASVPSNSAGSPQNGRPKRVPFHLDIEKDKDEKDDKRGALEKGHQKGPSVGFSDAVEVQLIKEIETEPAGGSSLAAGTTDSSSSETGASNDSNGTSSAPAFGNGKPKFSTRTLRAAFARVKSTDSLIGRTVSAELNADVEDILAPPISGRSVRDNATFDEETLVIPNLHLYQESMEEELEEIQTKGAYVWDIYHWKTQFLKLALLGKAFYIFTYPMNIPLFLTIPTTRWNRATALASLVLAWPILFGSLGFIKSTIKSIDLPIVTICIAAGAVLATILFFLTETMTPPRFKLAFLAWAFLVCVAWIYLIATELINALQAVGRILSIADILLGATVLTWGNSISDFVADSALAAHGDARIAMGALYGGPMFNMAFGIGAATLYGTIKALPRFYVVTPSILFWLMGTFLLFVLITSLLVVSFLFNYRLRWYYAFPLLYLYLTYFVIVILHQTGVIWKNSPYN